MKYPTNKLPGWYDQKGKFHVDPKAKGFIENYNGQLVKYRDLPRESQLAIAHYMAIDGEAWDIPACFDAQLSSSYGQEWEDRVEKFEGIFAKQLPFYVEKYGDEEFGYIEELPIAVLIKSCMEDADLAKDWAKWKNYHEWYMEKIGAKHEAPSNLWPVILSAFRGETLEDGWTRFHQYADRKLKSCPAVFYPKANKPEYF